MKFRELNTGDYFVFSDCINPKEGKISAFRKVIIGSNILKDDELKTDHTYILDVGKGAIHHISEAERDTEVCRLNL
jgi:hypothetical protein